MKAFSSRRALAALLVCACVCLTVFFLWRHFAPPDSPKTPAPALRVGLEDYYPPMAFWDGQGEHTGFDHDMAEALCRQINARCEFVIGSFDDVLRMLGAGELDMAVVGLGANDERRRRMEFTDLYYRSSTIYVGRPDLVVSREGLRGKKLAAQSCSMQLGILKKNWGDVAEVVESSFKELFAMLARGEVDAVLADSLACYGFLKSDAGKNFDIVGDPLQIDDALSQARIGVRKGRHDLVADLNKAVMALRVNGEYNRIVRKYFSFSIY